MVRSGSAYRLAALLGLVLACGSLSAGSPATAAGSLRVDGSGRYFVDLGGNPFFFLGDTATRMNHMLDQSDMDLYFRTRASQGFSVVLASAFRGHDAEYPKTNAYGEWPFVNDDITRPNIHGGYDYWDHIDYMIDTAGSYGLTVALVAFAIGWTAEGTLTQGGFRYLNASNAYTYGRWIGQRYGNRPNIVWVLGWDNPLDAAGEDTIWNEMGQGIKDGAGSSALITFHTSIKWPVTGPGSSSQWFHNAPWLDFNMVQATLGDIHPGIAGDYNLWPPKPTGMGEGPYENGTDTSTLEMRKQAYWCYLAGGYHISGNLTIWGFGDTGDWRSALQSTAAWQMRHVRNLFASRPWWRYVPDQSVFEWGESWGTTVNAAARSVDGDGVIAYLSSSTTVSVRMDRVNSGSAVDASWYSPTDGGTTFIGTFPNSGTQSFSTPGGWEDAVLILQASGGGPGPYSLSASPSSAAPGETVTVSWATPAGQGSSTDWIGLYAVGADNSSHLDFRYANGADNGSVTMPAPGAAGTYEFRYLLNNGYQSVATSNAVTVGGSTGQYDLSAYPSQAAPGELFTVSWTTPAGQGSSTDWIGLYAAGTDNSSYLDYRYASGADSGSVTMQAPGAPGTYEFRYLLDNGYQSAATSNSVLVLNGGGSGVYLSDLSWTYATSGWGPVERDTSNGEDGAGDGATMTLNGVSYGKGLGVHSYSELRYWLGGSYARFISDIGLDDEMDVWQCGSVVFQVWADGELLYDSGVMAYDSPTQTVDVDVTGRQELVLVVTDGGDDFGCDHADWADARLTAGAVAGSVQRAPSGGSSNGSGCGATGMEGVLVLGMILILSRSGRSCAIRFAP